MMLTAAVITDCSWILEDSAGGKLGIISYNASNEKYILVTKDFDVELDTFDELASALDDTIVIRERKVVKDVHKDINGYPICHESAENIKDLGSNLYSYNPEGKMNKEFYAGYWVTSSTEGRYSRRVSIPVDIYNELKESENRCYGPYSDVMEAKFMSKKLNKENK
ncbi:hypothetical protein NVP2275O_001, partial [Vibrio phage 2.275.O._10N.286.54.E11]